MANGMQKGIIMATHGIAFTTRMTTAIRWFAALAILAVFAPQVTLRQAAAADATVATCTESVFDAAIGAVEASGGGTITFDCVGTIAITTTKEITKNIQIVGNGGVILDRGRSGRFFEVRPGATLSLVYLTLQNGKASGYGGAIQSSGSVRVEDSTFINNSSQDKGGAIGAFSGENLTIIRSSFIGNLAQGGGAIYFPYDGQSLFISASTFFDNKANQDLAQENAGGAIYIEGGTTTIQSSTIVGNYASDSAGGIRHDGSSQATLTVVSSILAGNTDQGTVKNESCEFFGTGPFSGGYNLTDEDSCGFASTGDIQISTAINVADPAGNGGPTKTMALQTGSAAIDGASCGLATSVDQRGAPRPTAGTNCDIGAYESGATVPTRVVAAYQSSGPSNEAASAAVHAVVTGPTGATFSYAVDCDNNGSYETAASAADTLGRASCYFDDDGSLTVGVQVCNAANSADCDTAQATVTVLNVAPSIDGLADDTPGSEGSPVTITVDASDVAGVNDPLTYTFDCDNDADFETAGVGNQGQCTFGDNGDYTIGIQVADDDGGVTTDTTEVTVENVDPAIDQVSSDGPVDENSPVTITVDASDPAGINDPLTFSFDCDGNGEYETAGEGNMGSCTFVDNGVFTVGLQVTDDDGGSATSNTVVTVINVSPAVDPVVLNSTPANEGDSAVAMATFSDPGADDTHTCTVDYGDGSDPVDGFVEGNVCTGPSHIYIDDDPSGSASDSYPVTIIVTDDDDGAGQSTGIQVINNVAPVIDGITTNGPVAQGKSAVITVEASDVGVDDVLTYEFDCDHDGSYETAGVGSQGECALDPAEATPIIGVQVTDDDLGVTKSQVEIIQQLTLCVHPWTGALRSSNPDESCSSGLTPLVVSAQYPTTVCINAYSGALRWPSNGSCSPSEQAIAVPARWSAELL